MLYACNGRTAGSKIDNAARFFYSRPIMDERKAKKGAPDPAGEHWGLDPQDVRAHARRMREARAVGPLGKFFRFAALVLLLAVVFAAYWNLDTLRQLRFDFSQVRGAFEDAADDVADASRGGEPRTEVVGDSSVAGVSVPTSIKGEEEDAGEADAVSAPAPAAPAAPAPSTETAAANDAPVVAAQPVPAPEPEPEAPPTPETFGFGLQVMSVSEANASARVLVLRDGGRRGVSFITWWTTDGTAVAGSDFARLERRVERFGMGEQNRTLLVPIVGDRNREGPENFFVHIAVGESMSAPELAKIEVEITDDD